MLKFIKLVKNVYNFFKNSANAAGERFLTLLILISNKMLYLKSRVLRTLVAHATCATSSHKNLTRFAL